MGTHRPLPAGGTRMITQLDLFSGIGGFALAARWAGFHTVAFCEIDPFCRQVLAKHWGGVPVYDDIRTLTADRLVADGAGRIDLITGGFPCQPFSIAGKRQGTADDRHLWPEMLRVISEVRPTWIVGENVAHFVSMALDSVLSDLEREGYEAQAIILPACAVNAPHRRDRVWIVGHTGSFVVRTRGNRSRHLGETPAGTCSKKQDQILRSSTRTDSQDTVADAERTGLAIRQARELGHTILSTKQRSMESRGQREGHWDIEPPVGRVAHGVSRRVDRLRALGNAIVPHVVYPILQNIADQLQQEEERE